MPCELEYNEAGPASDEEKCPEISVENAFSNITMFNGVFDVQSIVFKHTILETVICTFLTCNKINIRVEELQAKSAGKKKKKRKKTSLKK